MRDENAPMAKIRTMRGYTSEEITWVTLDAIEAFWAVVFEGFPGPAPRSSFGTPRFPAVSTGRAVRYWIKHHAAEAALGL